VIDPELRVGRWVGCLFLIAVAAFAGAIVGGVLLISHIVGGSL
jgi:hypothetical protein